MSVESWKGTEKKVYELLGAAHVGGPGQPDCRLGAAVVEVKDHARKVYGSILRAIAAKPWVQGLPLIVLVVGVAGGCSQGTRPGGETATEANSSSTNAGTVTGSSTTTTGSTTGTTGSTGAPTTGPTSATLGSSSTDGPGSCGDSVQDDGEACDDGNGIDDDECTNACTLPACDDAIQNGGESGVDCGGDCPVCSGLYQQRWKTATQIPAGAWKKITGAKFTMTTSGGPVEIEISAATWHDTGDSSSAMSCRPLINGMWAGTYAGLPSNDLYHDGDEHTGYLGAPRLWRRVRVYDSIPAGDHTIELECQTGNGVLTVGSSDTTSLIIAREYTPGTKVHQTVSLQQAAMAPGPSMTKVPGSDLVVQVTQPMIEVSTSLPVSTEYAMGCLEWMDGAPIVSDPPYTEAFWFSGFETSKDRWTMWIHSRRYTVDPGSHTFSIRCHGEVGMSWAGHPDRASVIMVRELDEALEPSAQFLDPHGNGQDYEINSGAESTWIPLPEYSVPIEVVHGNLDIVAHLAIEEIPLGNWASCRPTLDGDWVGLSAGLAFTANQEEGAIRPHWPNNDPSGMWQRRRIYAGVPVGMHTVGLECLCTASGWKAGGTGIGSLLVRDVHLAYDGEE